MHTRSLVVRMVEWLRRDHGTAPDELLLVVALPLLRLPVAIGHPYEWPLRLLVLSPFMLSTARNLGRIRTRPVARVHGPLALLFAAYLGVLSVSYFRAVVDMRIPIPETMDGWAVLTVMGVYGALAFLAAASAREQERLRLAILYGLVVYLAVNVALFAAGVSHPDVLYRKGFPSAILGMFGLHANAVLFPMSGGINNFGMLAGAVAAMSGALLVRRTHARGVILLALIGFALGTVVMVLADVRAGLVFCILAVVALIPVRMATCLRALPVLPILVPPLFLLCLSAIPPDWWTAWGEGARQAATLSNRETIWHAVWVDLLAFRPIHLVGFGYLGQTSSGLSQAYLQHFPAYVYAGQISAHNGFLQTMMESGYVGTGILVASMVLAIGSLSRRGGAGIARPDSRVLLACLVFVNLAGITESTWSPMYQEVQVCLLLCLSGAAVSSIQDESDSRTQAPGLTGGIE